MINGIISGYLENEYYSLEWCGVYTLYDIYTHWRKYHESDPVLANYTTFEEWFNESEKGGYFERYYGED